MAKILFLTASVGLGHTSAAEAVISVLKETHPSLEIEVVDSYTLASPTLGRIAADSYIQMIKTIPDLYGFFYELEEKDNPVTGVRNWLNQVNANCFNNLIEKIKPDLIVCTHAFPCGIIALLKKSGRLNLPVVGIITDFMAHSFWIHREVDAYAVGSENLKDYLVKKGIAPEKIKVTGIPVKLNFDLSLNKADVRQKLGLKPELTTFLVMGGGLGLGPIDRIVKILNTVSHPKQIIVGVGTNQRLKKNLENWLKKKELQNGNRIYIFGFIENIYELMQSADVLISKPGGLTSSEALVTQLPMLIVNPIPGQEQRNTTFLLDQKVAIYVPKLKMLKQKVEELIQNPAELDLIKDRMKKLRRTEAAREVAELLVENIY